MFLNKIVVMFRAFSLILFLFCIHAFTACSTPSTVAVSRDTIKPVLPDTVSRTIALDSTALGPFYFPIHGKVISHFGRRGRRMHTGTDIKLHHGDTVSAAFSGVVVKASPYYGYGILVVLKHPDDLETYYAHLSKALVKVGDVVQYGTPVGLGGRTGRATTDHLHFEIRRGGKALNAEHFFNFDDLIVKTLSFTPAKEKEEDKLTVKKESTVPPVNGKAKYHTIKQGDTLYALALKYKTTVQEICRLNGIKKTTTLKLGRKLRVK